MQVKVMSRANEIYHLENAIGRELRRIQASNDVNKDTLLLFYNYSVAEGLSLARIEKRLVTVRMLSALLGSRFEEATKDDIVKLVARIEQRNVSQWYKLDCKKILKLFYKWLRKSDEYPPEVKWIKCGNVVRSRLLKKDLLTPQEANAIVENAIDIQDKALFSVLFDSGRRLGEILGLKIGDVDFDSIGARLRVDGKVGSDIARICGSQPRLSLWMDNHPDRGNPDSPLWVTARGGKVKQLAYETVRYRLKRAVARAGIKKRVWLYLLRHSRITPASTKLTYSEMCHVFGWKQGSDMPQFYVHLSGDDRDEAFLKMNGMESVNNGNSESSAYAPIVCPRCKRNNSPDAKYCNGCGLAFDLKFATEVDQRKEEIKEKIDTLSTELAKSPEVVDLLLRAVATLNHKKDN